MLEKLIRGVGMKLGARYVTSNVRAAAEGRLGPRAKAAYDFMAGKKRWTAGALGLVAAIAAGAGYPEAAAVVASAAGLLYAVGLLDAGWRQQPPVIDAWRGSPFYRLLADNAGTITTALATAWAFVQPGHCGSYDCDVVSKVLLGLGAGLAYLGCADAAWKSAPPIIQPKR